MRKKGLSQNSPPIIFDLIHSMEGPERGYFIKFAGKLGKGEKSLQLFEILSKMKEYDGNDVISKLGESTNARNLTALYHHLYNMIIRSLRLYHESKRPKDIARNLIVESEILFEKGLKKHASKTLKKAHKMAEELQDYLLLMDIAILVIREEFSQNSKDLVSIMDSSYDLLNDLHLEFGTEVQMRKLHHLTLALFRAGRDNPKHKKSLQKILKNELLASSDEPISFFAKYYKFSAKVNEAFIYKDRDIAHAYFKKMIELWEVNPKIKAAYPIAYRNLIANYLNNSIPLKKVDDFDQQMKNLEETKSGSLMQKVELFQSVVLLRQLYSLNYSNLDTIIDYMDTNMPKFRKMESHMTPSRLVTIQCNFIFIYFILGNLSSCIDWVNLILEQSRKDIRKDIKSFAAIIEMIIHYEQGNINYVEALHQTLGRKKKQLSLPESYSSAIIHLMDSLMNAPSNKEKINIYKNYTSTIKDLKDKGIQPLGIELIILWTTARSKKMSVLEIFNQKKYT